MTFTIKIAIAKSRLTLTTVFVNVGINPPCHTHVISEPIRPGRPDADRREASVGGLGE